jgi:hypothetical protein
VYQNQILSSFDKQLHLSDRIGEQPWHINLQTDLLSFGNKYQWHFQLLGTESEESNTWLWAWANTDSKLPEHLLVASRVMKAFGEQHNVPELVQPQFPLDQTDGHSPAMLASSICEANAYFRCPYEGGALFVLIMDENFPKCTDPPLQRVVSVFPQAIASLEIPDHQLAFSGYLDYYSLGYEQEENRIVVRENGEPVITATFDEQNRLTNLEATLKPTPRHQDESWDEGQLRRMLGG